MHVEHPLLERRQLQLIEVMPKDPARAVQQVDVRTLGRWRQAVHHEPAAQQGPIEAAAVEAQQQRALLDARREPQQHRAFLPRPGQVHLRDEHPPVTDLRRAEQKGERPGAPGQAAHPLPVARP